MNYTSINELDCFQFHDAMITDIQLSGSTMVWEVSAVNAMTTNTQNDNPKDMCIQSAIMTFENAFIEKLEYTAYQVCNSDWEIIESVEAVVAKDDEYEDILKRSTSRKCYVLSMEELVKIEDNKYHVCFYLNDVTDAFTLSFTFSSAIVKWDEYNGESWYEHPKWKNRRAT